MDVFSEKDLHLEATELRLGLPGSDESEKQSSSCAKNNNKRSSSEMESSPRNDGASRQDLSSDGAPVQKAQVVGWPPVQSHRKNAFKRALDQSDGGVMVKVRMDGAPYLRKIDLKSCKNYYDLFKALENMFKCAIGSEFVPTYEDKDGDWMLVGDVPWDMFSSSCKRMRIMKGFEAVKGCLGSMLLRPAQLADSTQLSPISLKLELGRRDIQAQYHEGAGVGSKRYPSPSFGLN